MRQIEMVAHGERLAELHAHAFIALKLACRGDRQIHYRERGQGIADREGGNGGRDDFGEGIGCRAEFGHAAHHPHQIAHSDGVGDGVGKDEYALRCRRVSVNQRIGFLNVEALELIGPLKVCRDHTFHRDHLARQGARRAATLHIVDAEYVVVGDGSGTGGGDADGTDNVGDVDRKSFVGFTYRIAVDQHCERVAVLPDWNGLRGKGFRGVVGGGYCRAVGGGDIEGDAASTGGRGEGHREVERGGTGIAFIKRHVVDREIRRHGVVVGDGARA